MARDAGGGVSGARRAGITRRMRLLRRHLPAVALGAWFDGEHDGGVGAHVVRCRRCRRDADALAELRATLRPAGHRVGEPAGRGAPPG